MVKTSDVEQNYSLAYYIHLLLQGTDKAACNYWHKEIH